MDLFSEKKCEVTLRNVSPSAQVTHAKHKCIAATQLVDLGAARS